MRTRLLPGLIATSVLAVAVGGCGDGGTGGVGGASTATASVTATTSGGPTTTATTGGEEVVTDGNDDFATAEKLSVGASIDAYLEPWSDQDFYVFQGTKDQAISLTIKAQETPFDPRTIDTILTLFDASMKRVAENDDATPRRSDDSQIFTVLPADGAYYVRVAECWSWAADTSGCAKPRTKLSTAYTLRIADLDGALPGIAVDTEQGNDSATATPVTYAAATPSGERPISVAYGRFEAADDVDVFSFDFPADIVEVAAGSRLVTSEWILREGPAGSGSTSPAGKVYLTTQADPTTRLAQIDEGNFSGTGARLWPPLDVAGSYFLFVEHPQAPLGSNDFYVALHGAVSSNPLEQNDVENDSLATPEPLAPAEDGSFYVEGDLGNAASDVDHFSFDVAKQTGKTVAAYCVAGRAGSGLVSFEVDLLDPTTSKKLAIVKETPETDATTKPVAVPVGAKKLVLRLSAVGQDPVITGTYYRCGVHFE